MKKLLIVQILMMITLPLQAQDITNKLGASGNYDVTDPSDNVLFRVQSDGRAGMGGVSNQSLLYIHSQSIYDPYTMSVIGEKDNGQTLRADAGGEGGYGVYGTSGSSAGSGIGVYGYSNAATGAGIKGVAGPTGANFGGHFSSSAMAGTGVYGEAHTYGGHFKSTAFPTGVGVYAEGTGAAGLFDGKVGIGTTTPEANLDVHGTVKVLGDWDNTTYETEEVYQALTDGFVVAHLRNLPANNVAEIIGKTDSIDPPTVIRAHASIEVSFGSYRFVSITFPVKKGDYWTITDNIGGFNSEDKSVQWIPLGQ